MRKLGLGLLGAVAVLTGSAASAAEVTVTPGTTTGISGFNDFLPQLSGLGLTQIATGGSSITLDENSVITFELLGSESGFNDTFQAGAVSYTEMSSFTPWQNLLLGSSSFAAGSLAGILNFSSVGGVNATVGNDGFGIFLTQSGGFMGNVFYLGFDDQITGQDDNHDDLVIRATVSQAVPEPATWAMMLMGFGVVGFSMRRRRNGGLAQIA